MPFSLMFCSISSSPVRFFTGTGRAICYRHDIGRGGLAFKVRILLSLRICVQPVFAYIKAELDKAF